MFANLKTVHEFGKHSQILKSKKTNIWNKFMNLGKRSKIWNKFTSFIKFHEFGTKKVHEFEKSSQIWENQIFFKNHGFGKTSQICANKAQEY